jgi:hypothetical protein
MAELIQLNPDQAKRPTWGHANGEACPTGLRDQGSSFCRVLANDMVGISFPSTRSGPSLLAAVQNPHERRYIRLAFYAVAGIIIYLISTLSSHPC